MNGTAFQARFQGSGEAPVIYLDVEGVENPEDVQSYFDDIDPFNEEVVLSIINETEASVQSEYADSFLLRGLRINVRTGPLEATDFERMARLNEEWGKSTQETLSTITIRMRDAKHLLQDQRRRLVEKAERHAPESTARVLYNQQISFIDRVLSKLDT